MPIVALILLFFFLELFLIIMAAIDHGWAVFWFEIGTAAAGLLLLQRNRETTMRDLFSQASGPRRIDLIMLKSARVMLAAVLLIVPGFITDAFGSMLVILPALRSVLMNLLRFPTASSSPRKPPDAPPHKHGRVIEGEVEKSGDGPAGQR